MKHVKRALLVVVATLVAMAAITTSALASASDFYLNLGGGIQGEGTTHVVTTPSGQIHVNEIPATGPCNTDRNPNCGVVIT
jgi:hypothetical protein